MSSHPEVFSRGVLHVTVHHVYYPVTEETLQHMFVAYGVVKTSVFQRINHVEAVVQLRSRHGAARALALHGRCIYERSCLLDIQDVSLEYDLHLCSLLELKQTATVAEYTTAFWERVHRVLDLNSDLNIKCFVDQYVKGLRNDIQAAVWSRSPSSITSASCLARIREDEIVKDMASGADKLSHSYGLTPTETLTEVFHELDAPAARDKAKDINTVSVMAPTPVTCLTGMDNGNNVGSPEKLPMVPWSVTESSTTPPQVVLLPRRQSFSVRNLDTMAPTRSTSQLDVTPSIKQQCQSLRPSPWPSFVDEHTSAARGGIVVQCSALLPSINPIVCPPWRPPDRAKHQAMISCIQSAEIVWMLGDARQGSCQTISSDTCAYPLNLQEVKNYEEVSAQWYPGSNHVFGNLIYLVEKRFRLAMHYEEMKKGWYLCNKFQIPEVTCRVVYNGLNGCKEEALVSINVLVPVDLWCNIGYMQTYLTKLCRYGQCGMIFADQEKMSDVYETARASKQRMVTEHQCMVTHTLFTYCYISVWLQSIHISVHLYMHFSTIDWWFRFSTWLKLLYSNWPNGGTHCSLYRHLVYAPLRQPSQLLDHGAIIPFYQGCVFDEVPHLRSAIIPERSARQGYHFSLEYIPPWRRNVFSPGPNTLVKYEERHLAWGDLQVKNQLTVQIIQWYSLLVQLKISRFVSIDWFPRIPILSGAVQEKAMHFQWRHMHEINSIDSVAGDELQINGKFQLLEDWRSQIEVVSSCKAYNLTIIVQVSVRYVRDSYVNRLPAYLDNISMPAVPSNFNLSAKKLHSTCMLPGAAVDRNAPDNMDRQMPWDPGGVCHSGLGASRNLRGRECHVRLLKVSAWSIWALGCVPWAWMMEAIEHISRAAVHGEDIEEMNRLQASRLLLWFLTSCSSLPPLMLC